MTRPHVPMADYDYELPPERVANHPVADRQGSRLLVARRGTNAVTHLRFVDVLEQLPAPALLVVNNTRVIRARVPLRKASGGAVEMLLLEPVTPSADPVVALVARGESQWNVMLSGRKLESGDVLRGEGSLRVRVDERAGPQARVTLQWDAAQGTLGELLLGLGHTPLPPYIKRDDEPEDVTRYQTVYARVEGSVAAPTAGLHFTPELLDALETRGISRAQVTLHVGAGTFRPVFATDAAEHEMHAERATVDRATVQRVAAALRAGQPVVAVGTTSVRTLESLAWLAARLQQGQTLEPFPVLAQWDWVELSRALPASSAGERLEGLAAWMERAGMEALTFSSQLMVVPGYRFQVVHGMVTNFHQPRSTLILLVAAYLGKDLWRRVYDEALAQGYRFLSYGDASLLLP